MARDYSASKRPVDWRALTALGALLAVGFYLLVSALIFRVGFPLDDTWIHLTYARNFAEHHEWAFRLGEQSAGSTSPLWTFLLSLGYLLRLAPFVWTFFLGWVVLAVLAICAEAAMRHLVAGYKPRIPWVGFFFGFAWHLTWSATSGMETLLHGLLIFIVLVALMRGTRRYLALGLVAGLSVWVRPDGLTLLGPILFAASLSEDSWLSRGRAMVKIAIGFGAMFLPYLFFNLSLSGNPLPNTFYAKQAEYEAFWLSKPFSVRLSEYVLQIFASPLIALIPGMSIWVGRMIRSRNWGGIAGLIWFFGYVAIYFMRLPAYQHGRYIIPALPILYFWGILGLVDFVTSARAARRVAVLWQTIVAVLVVAFTYLGAQQNARDVFWIESQMVETADWVRENIPPEAKLAVHDIGALGYFVDNPIVDLAGLITPEVVPFIRDESRLGLYLEATSSEYLIVFRSTYPNLTAGLTPVFVAGRSIGPLEFEDNLMVFRLR